MSHHRNTRSVEAIEKMIAEMQHLVDHPRIQQKTWVASGKRWLPILQHAKEDLLRDVVDEQLSEEPENTMGQKMLVKVNAGKGETYVNIDLDEVKQVSVSHRGEPGYYVQRGAYSGFELKDGRKFLTNKDEAQRIVDAMREK